MPQQNKCPPNNKRILIGIPILNEEKTLLSIITEAKQYGDILAINDGSTDNTQSILNLTNTNTIHHQTRLGYGASITDLFRAAKEKKYDILITIDSDGQHNPSEIPNFLKAISATDIVIGNRFIGKNNTPSYRKFGIKAISRLNGVQDSQCGFRAYDRTAINIISDNLREKGMGASVEILKIAQSNNLRITEIPCTILYGDEKHSKNPLSHGLDLILVFAWWAIWKNPTKTLLPLGLAFLLGSIITGTQTLNLYVQFHEIVYSWALFSIGSLLCAFMIFNALIFVLVFKNRKVNE